MTAPSYHCGNCGYIYNPEEHNSRAFGDLDIDWICPECQAEQDEFQPIVPQELESADRENHAGELETEPSETQVPSRRVNTDKSDMSIYELHRQHQKGNLILQPDFQRYTVWTDAQASRLIESVFLNVPIPMIYLSEEADSKLYVIDGQQRLRAFFRFMDNDLRLSGLEALDYLMRRTFADLDDVQQTHFENYTLRVIKILQDSDPDVKFDVFERLNTGGTHLNDQELRNCIYRGVFNDFLKKVAKNKQFLSIFDLQEPHSRMSDVELALRFFAFYDQTYLKYTPSMKRFMNRQMERCRNVDEKTLEDFEAKFKQAIDLALSVFGDYAFRRFVPGSEDDPNGSWEAGRGSRRFNRALYDIVMYGFTRYNKPQIMGVADSVREELIFLMTHDSQFIEAITIGTSDTKRVNLRFRKWLAALDGVVGDASVEPRTFSAHFKKQLYDQDQTCEICHQKIMLLDDAEVHHYEHYWRGGRTIPSNARLVHRYCNRSEGRKQPPVVSVR